MSERRGTKGLELWCRRMTEGYPGVKVENMTTSWRDGLAFCAIIHHFRPDLIDFSKLNKDDIYHNNELAFRIAERHLGIPALLEPEDMVECSVPDRLSILTYLSQFYQTFVTSQGSPSRIVPKRPASSSERPLVSPSPTGPSSKVPRTKLGIARRDPCAKCSLPVFIAERLSVGKLLFHRTCFRCARCNSQLSLANYYETESNQFCCETCPDEEVENTETSSETSDQKADVLTRSLSDEEKSANLKIKDEQSTHFETALEDSSGSLSSNSQQNLQFAEAMSQFINSQIKEENTSEEKPPELPKTQPPDFENTNEITGTSIKNIVENIPYFSDKDNIDNNNAQLESYDSGFPHVSSLDFNVNKSKSIVNDGNIKDQPKSAETQLDTDNKVIVTKDNDTSIVKSRMKLFENASLIQTGNNTNSTKKLSELSPKKSHEDEVKEVFSSRIIEETHLKKVESASDLDLSNEINLSFVEEDRSSLAVEDGEENHSTKYSNDISEVVENNTSVSDVNNCNINDVITIEDSPNSEGKNIESKGPNDLSVITISSNDDSIMILSEENDLSKKSDDYPEDLNPFGSDDDINVKKNSQNPFDSEDEEVVENKKERMESIPPKPAARKKIIPSENIFKGRISGVPEHLSHIYIKRISENPFENEEINSIARENNEHSVKNSSVPKAYLNPFDSDDEDSQEDSSNLQKPLPKPRNSRLSTNSQTTLSGINANYGEGLDPFGSVSSVTIRKKKIAPPPPTSFNDSDQSSISSSPIPSAPHSPRMTPRFRKTKKAPPPPISSSSTPFCEGHVTDYFVSAVSPISSKESHVTHPEIKIDDYEVEKINKDKENRNRQSQIFNAESPTTSPAINDKSTHGKWKRRKGPAPSRPIPVRRQIKPLPLAEIKRELDFIEVQQLGLERQGVRLEQIIREKCEGPESDPEAMPPDVEELILQLFELVNEKNELFRKQAELMYLRRQQRLEEEYADLEYQIRCLMLKPQMNQTDSDKAKKEEELINRLLEVVERRNEIVECLEMDRIREAEEDNSITNQMTLYTNKMKDEVTPVSAEENRKEWKLKLKKKFKLHSKPQKLDADKDIDESEAVNSLSCSKKEKKKKKFSLF